MSLYVNIPAQAAADAITVSANTGLSGDGTAGTPLAGVPASASAAGYESIANFNKLASVPTGSLLYVPFISTALDMLTVGATAVIVPSAGYSGKRFVAVSYIVLMTIRTATTVSTAPTLKYGQNVAHDDYMTTTAVGTGFGTAVAGQYVNGPSPSLPRPCPDMVNGDLIVEVVAAPTGTAITAYTGKVIIFGSLV